MEKPRRRQKSKRFVAKIMCLTAITRPRPGFNGVLGCWRIQKPFVYKKKTTFQGTTYDTWRVAGESRMKDCEMDGDQFAKMLKQDVFPAIRTQMQDAQKVTVQFDNAGGHGMQTIMGKIKDAFPAPRKRGRQEGPELEITEQEAQSPDNNGCDLGFFNSCDSTLPALRPFNLDAFFKLVQKAHDDYPAEKMDAIFDLKKRICKCMLTTDPPGDNNYKLPHTSKK